MRRVLLIDQNRSVTEALTHACLEAGVAMRTVETLCEGVRYLLDVPVSLVLVDAGLVRLSPAEQWQLFDSVAPEAPVIVLVKPNAPLEEHVRFEAQGFRVAAKPLDMHELLAKLDLAADAAPARRDAAARLRALCG